jgi:hypothetical protein
MADDSEKTPAEKTPEPKAPEPKADEPKAKLAPKISLSRALTELGKLTKLQGHQLLGHLASAEGAPSDLMQAAHDVAFVVNTGLAGHAAAEGLRKLAPEGLAKLLEETMADKPTFDELAKKIRDQFPEPKRPQSQV